MCYISDCKITPFERNSDWILKDITHLAEAGDFIMG